MDFHPEFQQIAFFNTATGEKVVARARTAAVGIVRAGSVGEPAATRSAGVAGSFEPVDCELTQAIEREVENYPAAQRLRTHPGVGVLTALGLRAGTPNQ